MIRGETGLYRSTFCPQPSVVPSLFQCLQKTNRIRCATFETPLPWRRKKQKGVSRNAKQAEKSETVTHRNKLSQHFQVSSKIMTMYEYVSLSLACKLSSRHSDWCQTLSVRVMKLRQSMVQGGTISTLHNTLFACSAAYSDFTLKLNYLNYIQMEVLMHLWQQ